MCADFSGGGGPLCGGGGGGVPGASPDGGAGGLGGSCASAALEIIVSAAAAIRTFFIALLLGVCAQEKHAAQLQVPRNIDHIFMIEASKKKPRHVSQRHGAAHMGMTRIPPRGAAIIYQRELSLKSVF
jgi:hypothetical protein